MYQSTTHLAHGIDITDMEAQYDENAKALMADKQVLARIAKYRTEEFKDYDIPTIIECIEGEPEISKLPVIPGKRRQTSDSEIISGMNTESSIPGEGKITFDIRFYMVTKDGMRIKIIVNIELQKKYHQKYHYEPRAVFYCGRMISEQFNREFTADNYDDLKKVYSIWIFFDAPQKDSDTITEYSLQKKDIYGKPVESWKYDYISISFIRLSTTPKKNSKHKLIHMLDTLFSDEISAEKKKQILETEHQMQMTRQLQGGIKSMCNVSQGIKEKAFSQGISQGISQGKLDTILDLLREGLISIPTAAQKLNLSEEEIIKKLK